MKFFLVVVAVLALCAGHALAVPNITLAKNATGIHWNWKAPINGETIENATKASALDRVMYKNGTIGHPVSAVLINGTWVVPENATATAEAAKAAEEAERVNLGEVLGCDMNIPSGFSMDKAIGEWCSLDIKHGGFMFRGIRDGSGQLWLQRFALSHHKSLYNNTLNFTMPTNSSASVPVQALLSIDDSLEDAEEMMEEGFLETAHDNMIPVSLLDAEQEFASQVELDVGAEADVDADAEFETAAETEAETEVDADADAEFEFETEEGDWALESMVEADADLETFFIQLSARATNAPAAPAAPVATNLPLAPLPAVPFKDPMEVYRPPPPPPPTEVKGADGMLRSLKNGYVLPELPNLKLSRCNKDAHDYRKCTQTTVLPLNGTEHEGWCQDDQYSADTALFLSKYTHLLDAHKSLLVQVSASPKNMAPTHYSNNTLNHEGDAVKFCFQAGDKVYSERYNVKGGYRSQKIGHSSGFYKPTLKIKCDSVFCQTSYLKKITYLNFQP